MFVSEGYSPNESILLSREVAVVHPVGRKEKQ